MESFEGEADENNVDRMAPGWTASILLVCTSVRCLQWRDTLKICECSWMWNLSK